MQKAAQLPKLHRLPGVGLNQIDRPEHRIVLLEHLVIGHGFGVKGGTALAVQPGDLQGTGGLTEPFRIQRAGKADAEKNALRLSPLAEGFLIPGK